jgi:CRISPR-associated endonuclease/helicase Cas3
VIYAKSNPVETLKEHTDALLVRWNVFETAYGTHLPKKVWNLLYLAAHYHDAGKVFTPFQNMIKKSLGEKGEKTRFNHIPHNYLSPFFVPLTDLELTKHEKKVLIQAITYHHERVEQPDKELLKTVFREELVLQMEDIQKELEVAVPLGEENLIKVSKHIVNRIKRPTGDAPEELAMYDLYILVKGLLHRLDHAASAHVDIEVDASYDLAKMATDYLDEAYGKGDETSPLRPLQQFTFQNQDKNVIIVAQTGMGKTEAALLWAGKEKTFFTLPIRVSLNSLFERVYKDMKYTNVGLLHGSSASHLDKSGAERWEVINDQSKQLSNKLLFTTIDQILKFPFKFKGYEKFYATMAYSRIVIDEIQAYSPWIVAVLIRAIEMIHSIGGRFMIMTATLPQIYLDELSKRGVIDDQCVYEEFVDSDFIRHRISLRDMDIEDDLASIQEQAEHKKVLVISNTVKKATDLYEQLNDENVYLLHSRFIQKDRALLEAYLKEFEQDANVTGIWITTQLVEASIDIDFDVLYTELSTVDSLFQRFGRCYRKRALDHNDPNIYIYTKEPSEKSYVYDADIMDISLHFLEPYHQLSLSEKDKMEIVKNVYSKETLADTSFLKEFYKALHELDNVQDYQYTSEEAQKLLRNIQSEQVIPRSVYDEIIHLFEQLETEQDARRRIKMRREIEEYTVSVSSKTYRHSISPLGHVRKTDSGKKYPLLPYIKVLEEDYDFDPDSLKGSGVQENESGSVFVE